eukprot:s311_g9.t1
MGRRITGDWKVVAEAFGGQQPALHGSAGLGGETQLVQGPAGAGERTSASSRKCKTFFCNDCTKDMDASCAKTFMTGMTVTTLTRDGVECDLGLAVSPSAAEKHREMSGSDFGDVHFEIRNGVALLTLKAPEGSWSWGTLRAEHRWNPVLVSDLSRALDAVEADSTAEVLVVSNEGRYWSNGMDLRYLDSCSNEEQSRLQRDTNQLMARVCCFPLPTVAAFKGHWCAAGGMMGLAFDFRVMSSDSGYFFIPGVDLGLVYAPMQVALMKAKLPPNLHRDVILFNLRRWTASELLIAGAIDAAELQQMVLPRALQLAQALRLKGRGPARHALPGIKRSLYSEVLEAMNAGEMSFPGRVRGVDRIPKL